MSYKKHLFFITLSILIPLASQNSGFFWDNVTFGYKMGNHLFYNGLFNFHFPNEFDPGHPPFLAFILASSWKLFGKNLLVSHIALAPFIYGFFCATLFILQTVYEKQKTKLLCLFNCRFRPDNLSSAGFDKSGSNSSLLFPFGRKQPA